LDKRTLTIKKILSQLKKIEKFNPAPKIILINRIGVQPRIHFPDLRRVAITYTDKASGDYIAIYGMKAWSREDFIKTVKNKKY